MVAKNAAYNERRSGWLTSTECQQEEAHSGIGELRESKVFFVFPSPNQKREKVRKKQAEERRDWKVFDCTFDNSTFRSWIVDPSLINTPYLVGTSQFDKYTGIISILILPIGNGRLTYRKGSNFVDLLLQELQHVTDRN